MKQTLLILIMMMGGIAFLSAQMIADFEDGTAGPLTLHVMGCGEWDNDAIHPVDETFMVVDNPDPSGINTSSKVLRFVRRGADNGGSPWGGFWANANPEIDVSANKYVHYMVWKPRVSPCKFKLEGGTSGTLEIESTNTQDNTGQWVDMVFDFSSMDGTYPIVALMPDFEDPLSGDDVELYIDNVQVNDNPNPITGGPPGEEMMLADFEDETTGPFNLHVMGCGEWDNDAIHPVSETFMVIDNPDPSGINTSAKVLKFIRRGTDNEGQPWGGFWANADPSVDVTDMKYVRVKLWKPRISPCKFKLEGGPSGTKEIESMNPQEAAETWVEMVFDFSDFTGAYPVIALMPDFEDPLTITGDAEIYIDDIKLTSEPVGIRVISPFEFSIYPNPCTDELKITTDTELRQVLVYNLLGQEVLGMRKLHSNQLDLNTSSLDMGIYFVTLISSDNAVSTKKLIKN